MNKRFIYLVITILIFSLILVKCNNKRPTKLRILVTPTAVSHSFWISVKLGAEAAGEDIGVDVMWKGPNKETNVNNQISII